MFISFELVVLTSNSNAYLTADLKKEHEAVVCENRKTIPNEYMFMRKIGTAFPDDVLLEYTR